jgi:CubicO group peptidase (beta-lactamase class C family)
VTDVDLSTLDLGCIARAHGVVGANLGLSVGGRRTVVSAGQTRVWGGTEVTAATRFLIGSVTKALVATVIVTMAVDGELDLDAPVPVLLPEVPDGITVRQLLTHTSGIPDAWPDVDDRSDAALARFVRALPPVHAPPGAHFGYSNAAYAVLGRIVEVLAEAPFEDVVTDRLLRPFGLDGASFDLAAVASGSFAVGHHRLDDGTDVIVERVCGVRSMAAAGSCLWTTVDDLLRFGEAHTGLDVAVPVDVRAIMHAPALPIPDHRHGSHMGVGMVVDDRWGTPMVLHDGGAVGQSCSLRIAPERGVVIALTSTGGVPQRFHRAVLAAVGDQFAGLTPPRDVTADPERIVDSGGLRGRYSSTLFDVDVDSTARGVRVAVTAPGEAPSRWHDLLPVDTRMFIAEIGGRPYSIVFDVGPDGRADRLLAGWRLLTRIDRVGAT